jgi:hypothetical protein
MSSVPFTVSVGFMPPGNFHAVPQVVMVPEAPADMEISPFCPGFAFVGLFSVRPAAASAQVKSIPVLKSGVTAAASVNATGAAALHVAPDVSILVGAELAMYSAAVAGTTADAAAREVSLG